MESSQFCKFGVGSIHVLNGGATVTHTLIFNSSVADDSGNYTCVAELVIPDSTNITQSATIELTFKSEFKVFSMLQFFDVGVVNIWCTIFL